MFQAVWTGYRNVNSNNGDNTNSGNINDDNDVATEVYWSPNENILSANFVEAGFLIFERIGKEKVFCLDTNGNTEWEFTPDDALLIHIHQGHIL